jgi:hypothetical protein
MMRRRRAVPELRTTTLRDFSGGLNVIDNELSLNKKYSPVNNNMVRYADGSIAPRFGYKVRRDQKRGVRRQANLQSVSITTTAGSPIVRLQFPANASTYPFVNGGHIQITQGAGLPTQLLDLIGEHGVALVGNPNAQSISVCKRSPATTTATASYNLTFFAHDTWDIGGKIIHITYFNGRLITVSDIGEVVATDGSFTSTKLWNFNITRALGGTPLPWRACTRVDSEIFGKELIIFNGVDKPIRIDFTAVNICDYHVDPGNSNSNAAIPAYSFAKSAFRYYAVYDRFDTSGPTALKFASKNTSVVFTGAPAPGDAVDIDIAKILSTNETEITGLAVIRDNLLVTTASASTLLAIGITKVNGANTIHEPEPADILTSFGTNSPKSFIELGNDVFMVDHTGVPSLRLSTQSNAIVPERVSQFIDPMMTKHLGRLSLRAKRDEIFSVYDVKNKYAHFCLPKYVADGVRQSLSREDRIFLEAGLNVTKAFVRHVDHSVEIGDKVRVINALTLPVAVQSIINQDCIVESVIDSNTYVLQLNQPITLIDPVVSDVNPDGSTPWIFYVDDTTISYVLHYVPALRLNAWYRFKNVKLTCGCSTAEGRTFFSDGKNILQFGSEDEPSYADLENYCDFVYSAGVGYPTGRIIFDAVVNRYYRYIPPVGTIYVSSGNFEADRNNNPTHWEEFNGNPIEAEMELPWADFGSRQEVKALRMIHIDAKGDAPFNVSVFADNIYKSKDNGAYQPIRSLQFVGEDAYGYGAFSNLYGTGRRTREQHLWTMAAKFKLMKLRVTSNTSRPYRIQAISFMYHVGSLVRG